MSPNIITIRATSDNPLSAILPKLQAMSKSPTVSWLFYNRLNQFIINVAEYTHWLELEAQFSAPSDAKVYIDNVGGLTQYYDPHKAFDGVVLVIVILIGN